MITVEKIVCHSCRHTEWWESRSKIQPYIGAIRAGWVRRGMKYTCLACRALEPKPEPVMHRTKFPIKFKRTK